MKEIYTKEDLKFMIDNYENMTYSEMGKILGFTSKQLRTKMSAMGYYKNRRFNNRYFKNIDTPLKAYFLGFIFADGWVCCNDESRNHEFGMELQSEDRYILEKLNKELGNVHIIKHENPSIKIINGQEAHGGHSDVLRVYSKPLVLDLMNNGIDTNKSLKDTHPNIDNDLFFDFLRGYIDGDGCYWNTKQRKNCMYMHITCASEVVLKYIQNILSKYNIKSTIYKETHRKYRLMCTDYNSMKILINNMYYSDDVFCLKRKKNKILKYLECNEENVG